MKKFFLFLLIISMVWLVPSCSKEITERTDNLPALKPANADLNAGSWKPVLLTGPAEFAVAVPSATNTPDYIAQVNEIKTWQANISPEEKRLVKYWSAGAVLRWNELMRALVAKHNLPPYQNPDGSYPIPNANNPLAYPLFPFANPPYAARAYAYVSAAQYDALVAAWHYKKLYNRPAPYKVDTSLQVLVPKSDLPSYPSEDAVVAGAAVEMMKLLFPGDQDLIQQKAEEQKRARIISGACVRSDIEAGEALGKAIAQKFVTRARGDRAGAAIGNQTLWTELETTAKAKGEIPWYSQDVPMRPPMLPLFGKVRGFLVDSLGVIGLRAAPPPPTSSEGMKKETAAVLDMVKSFSREHQRIVDVWSDGVGTYTPPGHWNDIAAGDFVHQNYSEVRWARNMALLNMAMMDAAIVCWDTKYYYFNPRPCQMDPRIKTLTGVPNFPSYISGHATFSAAAATILSHLVPAKASQYDAWANEAAQSRFYAGIHYLVDCTAGLKSGNGVGAYAVQRAKTDGGE